MVPFDSKYQPLCKSCWALMLKLSSFSRYSHFKIGDIENAKSRSWRTINAVAPFDGKYPTSYLIVVVMFDLSLTRCEIFANEEKMPKLSSYLFTSDKPHLSYTNKILNINNNWYIEKKHVQKRYGNTKRNCTNNAQNETFGLFSNFARVKLLLTKSWYVAVWRGSYHCHTYKLD